MSDSTFFKTDNINQEIEMFASIFNEVFVLKKKPDEKPFSIQVSGVNDLAYEVFSEMVHENQIDKYIKHLTVERHFKKDFCQKAIFEIDRYKSEIIKNKYFYYLIEGTISPTIINPLYIDVSGFSIEEIENDEYVQQLATQVENLYLIVFQQGSLETSFYTKQLRWYI